jgi:hypothetical protein
LSRAGEAVCVDEQLYDTHIPQLPQLVLEWRRPVAELGVGVLGVRILLEEHVDDFGPLSAFASSRHDPQGSAVLGGEGVGCCAVIQKKLNDIGMTLPSCESEGS